MTDSCFYHVRRAKTLPLTEYRLKIKTKQRESLDMPRLHPEQKLLPRRLKNTSLPYQRAHTEQGGEIKAADHQMFKVDKEERQDSQYLMNLLKKLDTAKYRMNNGSLASQLVQSTTLPRTAPNTTKSTLTSKKGILGQLEAEKVTGVPKRRREQLKMRMKLLSMTGSVVSRQR